MDGNLSIVLTVFLGGLALGVPVCAVYFFIAWINFKFKKTEPAPQPVQPQVNITNTPATPEVPKIEEVEEKKEPKIEVQPPTMTPFKMKKPKIKTSFSGKRITDLEK